MLWGGFLPWKSMFAQIMGWHSSSLSIKEFGAVAELFERFWIGECIGVFHLLPMHHISHCQLDDLAADSARNIGHREYFCRHMPRRGVGADDLADLLLQGFVQFNTVLQPH